jgi:hypothetical protein
MREAQGRDWWRALAHTVMDPEVKAKNMKIRVLFN